MLKKTLQCLEGMHLSQSGALLLLYVDKLLNTPFRVLARMVDTLACRRVEMLLAETLQVSHGPLRFHPTHTRSSKGFRAKMADQYFSWLVLPL